MKLKLFLIICLFIVLVVSVFVYLRYLSPDFEYHKPPQAAFVISFDDQYVTEWFDQRDLFKKHGIRATFFITNPDSLTSEEINMLKALAADGHGIGSHGANHVNSLQYIEAHGLDHYIGHEVVPSINIMQAQGFAPVTFAYPYGANSRYTDKELAKYFYLLRGDSWKVEGKSIDTLDKIYYNYDGRRVINGLEIDFGSGVTIQDIHTAFARVAKRKEAVVLYAHSINNSKHTYSISPAILEDVFKTAKQYQLISLPFKNLVL